ncbi:MAG: hydroxymethylbilane synthase [Betaproteobacteria bacterium]
MFTPPSQLQVALRKSALSLWHGQYIRGRLLALYPQCDIMLRGITTQGDRILDQPLAEIGGKGLFIQEIEQTMVEGRADFAVHSLKDMPMEMTEGFVIAAVPVREDPRDALLSNHGPTLDALRPGAIVGTSSQRREAQLRERNPGVTVQMLRGNVNTRVKKFDDGQYDAIILAAAGLNRLEQGHRITALLDPAQFLPAVGQGALALECPVGRTDIIEALAPLIHMPTLLAVTAERAFSRALSGSCHTPLAGYALFRDGELWLRGLLAARDGSDVLRGERSAPLDADHGDPAAAEALGQALAADLLARGAARFLGA